MTIGRRLSWGLADQAVIAAANAGNGLLATVFLPPAEAGIVLVCLATVYVAMGLNRAFIGDVLLAQASRFEGPTRRRMHTDAIATACCTGTAVAVVLALLWLLWPGRLLDPLIYVVPFIPALFAHDTARYSYQSQLRQRSAFVIDIAWVAVQGGLVGVGAVLGALSGSWLLVAWGLGACTGAVVYLLRGGIVPWRGRPVRWLAHTRKLSVWFTGSAVIGQAQIQLIALLIPSVLGAAAFAGLRLAQLVILQPIQNLVLASMGLLVPRTSTLTEAGNIEGLRNQTKKVVVIALGLAVVLLTVVTLAAEPVLSWYQGGAYAEVAPLAWPVGIQAGIYLLQIPFTAMVRGMRQGKLVFLQYAVFTVTSLLGVGIGATGFGLTGAAWGLTFGSAVGLAVMAYLAMYAMRQLTTPPVRQSLVPAESSA